MTLVMSKADHRLVYEFLNRLDCARSLTVWILFEHQQFEDIVNLSFNPLHYNDVETARHALQATELLRKHEDLPTSIDKDAVAMEKFLEAERVCSVTNDRMRESNSHDTLIFSVRQKIASILGDLDIEEILELSGWGPGVTLTRTGREATVTNKFRQYVELTPALGIHLKPCMGAISPRWQPHFKYFEGNRVITVPKNAKTNRVIAVEPSMNLFLQKGVGSAIRKRLKRCGVDLRDQTVNQKLAQSGSLTGLLATVDFSAASDTISYMTIMELLPYNWFQLLDTLRSPRGFVNGELIEWEKFSSMGNGFTFELESLIFYAIAKSLCTAHLTHEESPVNIYGDDLICLSRDIEVLLDAFSFFGFKINESKSYWTTYYRESCGSHFWGGTDITPVYLRRYLYNRKNSIQEIYSFHNRVVELSRRTIAPDFRDKRYKGVISYLFHSVPERARIRIPYGFGNGGFYTCYSDRPVINRKRARQSKLYQSGFVFAAYSFQPKDKYEDDDAVLLTRLYNLWKRTDTRDIDDSLPGGNEVVIPRQGYYVLKRTFSPDWLLMGPWI